ncbi:MAG TPA: hypothetical protein VER33_13465 [Polyangiaceae bacterium]|nr:hypothetical protein [Polyangiaceae bacterium]
MTAKKSNETLHITQQFRAGRARVYDFKWAASTLTVRVFPRENEADPGDWRIEARTTDSPEALVVAEWATTRTLALQQVGKSWDSKTGTHGLPAFDWDAVTRALVAVRAL